METPINLARHHITGPAAALRYIGIHIIQASNYWNNMINMNYY